MSAASRSDSVTLHCPNLWCTVQECVYDFLDHLTGIVTHMIEGSTGSQCRREAPESPRLAVINTLGVSAVAVSTLLVHAIHPPLWYVAIGKAMGCTKFILLLGGLCGTAGFLSCQHVMISFGCPLARGDQSLCRWTVGLYTCTALVPPLALLALQQPTFDFLLWLDTSALAASSFALTNIVNREQNLIIRMGYRQHRRSSDLTRNRATLVGAGPASPALVAACGMRSCLCFSLVFATSLPSNFGL
eukprot:gnl/TRDRNA2_/TRDRNA2_207617_c0_seq1.p1 gnl/TRDRNA2_/TRDRNA2_207617_c0~~gnl/TRDRNA2_/TRDRNA2_207617_c0_seq1.p1  ORF type:complete len:245 (+),score=17.51 gnl/TRDRNA2_/TRDRNA2_207617_c0_seq1:95-829(+)